MLDTISSDRIRYELECVFQEEFPEKVLCRAEELGVLQKLHSGLTGNDWLADKFEAARKRTHPTPPSFGLYLALMAYRLSSEESESLISQLRLPNAIAQTVRDTAAIRTEVKTLGHPEVSRNHIYFLLHRFSPAAIMANSLATKSQIARQHLDTFFNELRYVKPALTGNNLIQMGVPAGPQIKEILQRLHEARLDGEVASREDEEELVKGWLAHKI